MGKFADLYLEANPPKPEDKYKQRKKESEVFHKKVKDGISDTNPLLAGVYHIVKGIVNAVKN